jgi:hypothetical protein
LLLSLARLPFIPRVAPTPRSVMVPWRQSGVVGLRGLAEAAALTQLGRAAVGWRGW